MTGSRVFWLAVASNIVGGMIVIALMEAHWRYNERRA